MITVKINKFNRTESFKDLPNIIRSQRECNTSQEQPVVRDRSMFVLVDIESSGNR